MLRQAKADYLQPTSHSRFDGYVIAAVERAARDLDAFSQTVGNQGIYESRHLRFPFVRGLAQAATGDATRVVEELRFEAGNRFLQAGSIDVGLVDADAEVGIELKAVGTSAGALFECVWDAVKLATWVDGTRVRAAYLVAAAPSVDWALSSRDGGREFFSTVTHDVRALLAPGPYATAFAGWMKKSAGKGPVSPPARFATTVLATQAEVTVPGAAEDRRAWEIRAARIEVPLGTESIVWAP